jgi:hypothetical protein
MLEISSKCEFTYDVSIRWGPKTTPNFWTIGKFYSSCGPFFGQDLEINICCVRGDFLKK